MKAFGNLCVWGSLIGGILPRGLVVIIDQRHVVGVFNLTNHCAHRMRLFVKGVVDLIKC